MCLNWCSTYNNIQNLFGSGRVNVPITYIYGTLACIEFCQVIKTLAYNELSERNVFFCEFVFTAKFI